MGCAQSTQPKRKLVIPEKYVSEVIAKIPVFKNLKEDPQNVKILGSIVTRLPQSYKKNKLGHNWSISWVVDQLN